VAGIYLQATEADPLTWKPMSYPAELTSGATWLSYDSDHKILYSSNYWDGVWRVVME